MKRIVSFLLKLGLIVFIFLLIFYPQTFGLEKGLFGNVKPKDVWDVLAKAFTERPGVTIFWLVFACFIKLMGIFSSIFRWKLLLRGQGLKLPLSYMCYLWFMGRAIGLFLPGTLGLDGFKLVESARYTGEWVKCTTVVAIEKLIGFLALTFLVFLTFPFGLKLLDINIVLFSIILLFLLCFVLFCFTLLFQPRIIQVLAAVLPAPNKVRLIVNRVGAAATAYSANRGTLLLAVLFGIGVHVGTCLMYFGTMMALRPANISALDVFFVSPLIIYFSVLTPTVSGLGVRELVSLVLLGKRAGEAVTLAVFHLGLWAGEIIPYVLSIPLLLFGRRPSRERLEEDLKELRDHVAAAPDVALSMPEAEVAYYGRKVWSTVAAGIFGGGLAGGILGMLESGWFEWKLPGLAEAGMYWWGALYYGVVFGAAGLGIAGLLIFFYLLFNRFAPWLFSMALSFAATGAAGAFIIGKFRYGRDILQDHAPSLNDYAMLAGIALAFAAVGFLLVIVLGAIAKRVFSNRPKPLIALGAAACVLLVAFGSFLTLRFTSETKAATFKPAQESKGPNVILIAVDTLRADYLKLYNQNAAANTPNLDAFAEDAVLFSHAHSQASWTKPAFGTIFTGLYPESHRATGKNSALPSDINTLAERLQAMGYFTQGFANNPNISMTFQFDQGFVDYQELKPDLYFLASPSASKLTLYGALRKALQIVQNKAQFLFKMKVTDFYQPAEVVTSLGLDWLEMKAPKDAPYYLFLHYMDPHDPYFDPAAPAGGYARARGEHPDPETMLEPMRRAYIHEIEHLDQYLGELFEGLRQQGQYDNTFIVFTADHGEEFFDHKGWWHGKTLYEEQLAIPLLIKFPGNAPRGPNNHIARQVDLAPTILAYAEAPMDPLLPGKPLYLPDGKPLNGAIGYSYAENDFEGSTLQSITDMRKKLILANPDNLRGLEPVELYNLETDSAEQTNLAEAPANDADEATLHGVIDQYQKVIEKNAAEPVSAKELSEAEKERLRQLGYLGE